MPDRDMPVSSYTTPSKRAKGLVGFRRQALELARLVDMLEIYYNDLEPLVSGEGAHGPLRAVMDACNHRIDELFEAVDNG